MVCALRVAEDLAVWCMSHWSSVAQLHLSKVSVKSPCLLPMVRRQQLLLAVLIAAPAGSRCPEAQARGSLSYRLTHDSEQQ